MLSRSPLSRPAAPLLALLLLLGTPAAPLEAAKPLRIRKITVVRRDIFDVRKPGENKPVYRLVNKLHFTTKDEVVRREMLMKEGDLYEPRLRKETERALRRVLRLRRVKITPVPVSKTETDLLVEVQETWSTEPTLSLSGVGSDLSGKVGFREKNLFGYGKEASFFYKKDVGKISRSYSYGDPNVFGTRLRLDANYDQRDHGLGRLLNVDRPFYSTITPWSASFRTKLDEDEVRLFDNGSEVAKIEKREREIGGTFARSFGSTTSRIRRAGLGYREAEDRLVSQAAPRLVLRDKTYHVLSLSLHLEKVDFLTVNRIKFYDQDEDFALGPSLNLTVGRSGGWMKDGEPATFVTGKAFHGRRFGVSRFDLSTLDVAARFEDGEWRSSRTRLDHEYYHHFSPRQTLAVHFQAEGLVRPDASAQVLLGGDRGLRGYQLNQFAGTKLLLGNVEERVFLIDDLWKLVGLGGVAFVDSGYVWDRGRTVRLRDFKTNVGAGLRFHISRSSVGNVLRLDVAYALNAIPGESRVVVTFGSSQAF